MIAISACLIGQPVRYDGQHKRVSELKRLVDQGLAISICPEVLGGLPIPRPAAEIVGGDGHAVLAGTAIVQDTSGADVSALFIEGAHTALRLLQQHGVTHLVLKANSPSCSSHRIYQGDFSGDLRPGVGVATALFQQNHLMVWDESHPDLSTLLQQAQASSLTQEMGKS